MSKKKEQDKDKTQELVKMIHADTKAIVDVHPLEQLNYFRGGYRKIIKGD